MTRASHEFAPFRRVLALALPGTDPEAALAAALRITEPQHILLLGLVVAPSEESLAWRLLAARELRSRLRRLSLGRSVRTRVRVTHAPWREVTQAVQQEQPDLLVIGYPFGPEPPPADLLNGLARPPCDVALAHGSFQTSPARINRILIPIRGGPYAELAVRLALAVAETTPATITALHVRPPADAASGQRDLAFGGLARVLARLPAVTLQEIESDDEVAAILAASREADLVVMGSAARITDASLGRVADRVIRESSADVLLARSRRAVPAEATDPAMAQGAVALLVDNWLAENTFHADEFAQLDELLALKAQHGAAVSLVLPTYNDEATVDRVIRSLKSALYDKAPLLDEIVVIDAGSTDRTCEIAADLGVPVYSQQEILPQYGALPGPGEALWKSLYLTRGDLIVWLDAGADLPPRAVCGLLGPLLSDPRVQFVKGFGHRGVGATAKGQVEAAELAELAVRPLLSLLYPELSGVVQLLNRTCAGRRAALERLPFHAGAGILPSLLLEIFERYGLTAIAQVELPGRLGDAAGRSAEALAETTYAVAQLFIRKLERQHGLALVDDVNRTIKLVRADADRFYLELREAREQVRPPMADIPEYRASRSGEGES